MSMSMLGHEIGSRGGSGLRGWAGRQRDSPAPRPSMPRRPLAALAAQPGRVAARPAARGAGTPSGGRVAPGAAWRAAEDWIETNQPGRRNLTRDQVEYFTGRRYNRSKKAAGGRADRDLSGGHSEHPKTADELAAEYCGGSCARQCPPERSK